MNINDFRKYLECENIDINLFEHQFTPEEKLKWWGNGGWIQEPDLITFSYKDFMCLISRSGFFNTDIENRYGFGGHLCGYVEIPFDHPYYGKDYSVMKIDVHGGLTYCDYDNHNKYFIGFDCAHIFDYVPSVEFNYEHRKLNQDNSSDFLKYFGDIFQNATVYKNIIYCINECKSMVDQLLTIKENDKL